MVSGTPQGMRWAEDGQGLGLHGTHTLVGETADAKQ